MPGSRCALLFAVLSAAPGCFSDGGADLTHTATSMPPDSSTTSAATSTSTSTSTSSSSASSTGAPDPTSTSGPDPTSTSDASTGGPTTDPPVCAGDKQCEPGDVMHTGALCDPCGRIQTVCQQDCTWGPEVCADDLSSCNYWYFESDLGTWNRVALPLPPPQHAPTQPVAAAFDLVQQAQIIALTQTTYHVYSRFDDGWVASGAVADLLPGIGTILQAFAVYNENLNGYDVVVITGQAASVYNLPAGTYQAEFVEPGSCCDSFNADFSPASIDDVRDIYTDLPNAGGWGEAEFVADCFDNELHTLGPYCGWVTPTDVYFQDLGYCFELVAQAPYGATKPFAAPGAPPGNLVGGVALLGARLYVFAGG